MKRCGNILEKSHFIEERKSRRVWFLKLWRVVEVRIWVGKLLYMWGAVNEKDLCLNFVFGFGIKRGLSVE